MPLRLLIVDDNEPVRRGIRAVLSDREDWLVCAEACDGIEATELARKLQPDVVLMDMSMPRMGGAEATKIIRREMPNAKVILVTQNEGSVVRQQIAQIGAQGYVSKASVTHDLVPAILEVTGGAESAEGARKPSNRPGVDDAPRREVADKTQASEVLAESEERLRWAMEAAEMGLWNWYPDRDLATWENERMYDIFGRSPHDGPVSTADFVKKFVHPADAPVFQNALREALENGRRFSFQGRFHRADGQLRWVEFRGRSEFRPDGSVSRMMGTARDISDYKRTEETIRQQRERYDLVAEATQVGFWFCDLPFDKLIWDHRVKEHFWLPPDADVTIHTFYERLHPDDQERTRRAIEYSNQNDTKYDIEYRTVSPDGRIKWIRAMGRTFYGPTHKPIRFDGVTMDITEKKRAEENYKKLAKRLEADVQQQTAELKELSRNLLHAQDEERRRIARELHDSAGQTLAVLSINLARLAEQVKTKSPDLSDALQASELLAKQLQQEIRTASYLLHPPLLDESGLASALSWYLRGLSERTGLVIDLQASPELGRFSKEVELLIFRIVQECLTNIHRHSGSKSAAVCLFRNEPALELEVRDCGRGIPAQTLAELQAGASGMGIRGMRERVRHFSGEITIESDASGTRIRVTVPIPGTALKQQNNAGHPLQVSV